MLGIGHDRLAYKVQGLDFRLPGIEDARVINDLNDFLVLFIDQLFSRRSFFMGVYKRRLFDTVDLELRRVCLVAILLLGVSFVDAGEPLKVYVLVGQSNMEGHARVSVMDYMGDDPATASLLGEMKNPDGTFRMIDDVWISYLTGESGRIDTENREVFGQLTVGYGNQGGRDYSKPGEKIGPELAFGITMHKELDQPILLIKTAWGGQSLHTDFRSPSSGPYVPSEDDVLRERFVTNAQKEELQAKTGARYRQMIEYVRSVLGDIQRVYPDYDSALGYELAGLVWFQGFNDMVGRNVYPEVDAASKTPRFANYTKWFANFIRDVRSDLSTPNLPVVIGVMGVDGETPDQGNQAFRDSQIAVANLPEFSGNVFAVPTAPYWDVRLAAIDSKREQLRQKAYLLRTSNKNHENADGAMTAEDQQKIVETLEKELLTDEDLALEQRGKSNAGYHYLGSAKTYSQIGQAFAQTLLAKQRER